MVVEAGWGRISIGSALAGLFVAIGMVALLVGATAAIADGAGYDADVATNWNRWGMVAGLGAALLLFVCFLYGSYTAGRMARRRRPLAMKRSGRSFSRATSTGGRSAWVARKNSSTVMFISSTVMSVEASRT